MTFTLCLGVNPHHGWTRSSNLLQLLLRVLLPAPLVLRPLAELPQPMRLQLGRVDLAPQLLLHPHLFHLNAALLLLRLMQPEGQSESISLEIHSVHFQTKTS